MRYTCCILGSHLLLYWAWLGAARLGGAAPGAAELLRGLAADPPLPTAASAALYLGFVAVQAAWALALPGPVVRGAEAPRPLLYRCNGVWCWAATLVSLAALQVSGLLPLRAWVDRSGSLLTTAVLAGNAAAALVHLGAFRAGSQRPGATHCVRDFFMGVARHPRLGGLDIKMFCEIRVSWILLAVLCLSCAAKQHHEYGSVSSPMMLVVATQLLYTNACMKGEECIPTTWDIAHEYYGWMLAFWNLAGVPFLYCTQALYLCHVPPFEHGAALTVCLAVAQAFAYWMWDTANSQKNRYRMMQRRTFVPRRAPPQFAYGTLRNPRSLKLERGTLLVDGWWRHLRKPHYTADLAMALVLGLACGGGSVLPYIYVGMMAPMLVHRARRDERRMRDKYGEAGWSEYVSAVPWVMLPGIY